MLVGQSWVAGPDLPQDVDLGSCSVATSDTTLLVIGGWQVSTSNSSISSIFSISSIPSISSSISRTVGAVV